MTLDAARSLTGAHGAYRLVGAVEAVEIPATVQTVLASRIDRLGDDEKRTLQTASVIGKEFSGAILAAVVAADERGQLVAPRVTAALDALRAGEFVYETALYPEVEYAFKHPLTQEVAYRSQLGARRAQVPRADQYARSPGCRGDADGMARDLAEARRLFAEMGATGWDAYARSIEA